MWSIALAFFKSFAFIEEEASSYQFLCPHNLNYRLSGLEFLEGGQFSEKGVV
jgi:hypothetical protein